MTAGFNRSQKQVLQLLFPNTEGVKAWQIVAIMSTAVSIWLVVRYFDDQVGYSEVIALFCRGSPLGFVAVSQIQSSLLQFFKSSANKFTDYNIQILYSILSEGLAQVTK